jgi:hypothetical protein
MVPEVMEAGQSQPVTVTMQNSGVTTWTRSGSYGLGSQSSQDNINWGRHRVELPADISPGTHVTYQFNIVAPEKGIGSGKSLFFRWKMLQELVEWFGVSTPLKSVRVVPRTGTTTLVPDVREIQWTSAKTQILDAFLNPVFTGDSGQGAWVQTQEPRGDTVVPVGSTVKVHLKTGLIP